MNYLLFYLVLGTFLVFSSLTRAQQPEIPPGSIPIPSNWKPKCIEDNAWCDALIDNLLAAKEIGRLSDGSPHFPPAPQWLTQIRADCEAKLKGYSLGAVEKCYSRKVVYIRLFDADRPQTPGPPRPGPPPYPGDPNEVTYPPVEIPSNWKQRCTEESEKSWCARFLDRMIAVKQARRLFEKFPGPPRKDVWDKIESDCATKWGPEKRRDNDGKVENVQYESCVNRNRMYKQLFGDEAQLEM